MQEPDGIPQVAQWFDDPQLQAGLEAAVQADWQIGLAVEEEPDKVRHKACIKPAVCTCVVWAGERFGSGIRWLAVEGQQEGGGFLMLWWASCVPPEGAVVAARKALPVALPPRACRSRRRPWSPTAPTRWAWTQ